MNLLLPTRIIPIDVRLHFILSLTRYTSLWIELHMLLLCTGAQAYNVCVCCTSLESSFERGMYVITTARTSDVTSYLK